MYTLTMLWLTATATDVTSSITRQSYIFLGNPPNKTMVFYVFLHLKWENLFGCALKKSNDNSQCRIRSKTKRQKIEK